jgi:hypothetical protein
MAATTVKFQQTRHQRRRNWLRTRRAKKYLAWLGARAAALTGTGLTDTFTADVAEVLATGILTLTGQPLDLETVTIGKPGGTAITYIFDITTLNDLPNHVLIGATASITLDNLIAAIEGGAGEGTLYGTGTVAHTEVNAAAGAGDTVDLTAEAGSGLDGNLVETTESLTNGSFGAGTLTGGAASSRFTAVAHALTDGEGPLVVTTSVADQPAGLELTTPYWAIVDDANTFRLSPTKDGANRGQYPLSPVVITDAGTGTHSIARAAEVDEDIHEWNKVAKSDTIQAATDIDTL